MSILYQLNNQSVWQEYLEYKLEKDHFTEKEKQELIAFIEFEKYDVVVRNILNNEGLSIPQKKLINKFDGNKRVVYSFQEDENRVLKLLSYLLYRYDNEQSPVLLFPERD